MKKMLQCLLTVCVLLALVACSAPDQSVPTIPDATLEPTVELTEAVPETSPESQLPTMEAETVPAEETTAPTEPESISASEEATTTPEESADTYLVHICRPDFPIYTGPSYDDYPISTVEIATVYTIVEESVDAEGNLWGKLKSGAGWVDLTLNEKETLNMPFVTVSRASQKLLNGKDYIYCLADSSVHAYDVALLAHEMLTDVSFFPIEIADEFVRGSELIHMDIWAPDQFFVAKLNFPGSMSSYGLEFTDSQGNTHIYCVWESGRDGGVHISLLDFPLESSTTGE